ncbi:MULTISPECIES: glycine cleavage system protein H [unclassified Granulicatella]|uniref:glycine cleavage system protein H n=1 Tax=unclassified Granulicatella TaxID=2630493 RepID=UPI0010738898|nr:MULTISPECIES: glycine cleavage system protein H [unclassified Granulicatella]MBF0779947.1 glycine cleavage system protein H [Granulicatella sp. 19428wC4_WM01]TFU95963.1 glycine cleavage system protein H [Granulicatella sp. WM01]
MRYSENGFWVQPVENNRYRIGLSAKGQDDLGDISFFELVSTDTISTQEPFIAVEASKAVSDLVAPMDNGKITAIHERLSEQPELLNSPELEDNWIVEVSGDLEKAYLALNQTDGLCHQCQQ